MIIQKIAIEVEFVYTCDYGTYFVNGFHKSTTGPLWYVKPAI